MPTGAASTLLGRDRELGLIDGVLHAVREGSGPALMFSGEPGSGKTALLAQARRQAGDITVVECRGVEWEAELPFSGLHELVRPLLGHLPALPDPQRQALEEALGLAPADEPRPLHLFAGTASLLAEATRARPVLLMVDDLQWVDSPTVQVLSFLARRIRGESLGMLLASRPGTELPGWPTPVVPLAPLGHEAVAQLACRQLGRPLPEPAVRDLARAAGGNPLAIVESLAQSGDDLSLRGSPLDEPLPVGDLIERRFADRLDALSRPAQRALDVIAASLSDDAQLLRTAIAALGTADGGLEEAELARVIALDGTRVQFAHPLLRALAHRRTGAADLRRAHAALSDAASDPGLRAWHAAVAATEPDEAIAADLDAAAGRFERRGGSLAAAQALARAGELTPGPDARALRLLRAGEAANQTGSGRWTLSLYDRALESAVDPKLRLQVELKRTCLLGHLEPLTDLVSRQLALAEAAAGVDASVRVRALAAAIQEGLFIGRRDFMTEAMAAIEEVRAQQVLSDDDDHEVASGVAAVLTSIGEPGPEGDYGRAQLHRSTLFRIEGSERINDAELAEALGWLEDYELAARLCDHIVGAARPRGDALNLAGGLWARACLRYRTGDWSAANADLDEAIRVFGATEHQAHRVVLEGTAAVLQASQGIHTFVADVAGIEARSHAHGFGIIIIFTATALGLVELGAGRAAEAISQFERARDWQRNAGHVQPAIGTWPADLVEAYALAGRPADARAQLDELRAWGERVGRRWALAAAARLEGLLGDEATYEGHFVHALQLYETAGDPFGRARAQLAYGQRLRRSRRRVEARAQLTAALAAFEHLGARPWVDQTRRELGASVSALRKGPQFDPDALTPQESQVAGLVAGGASNKEVAASMFLSPKTIETHLSRVYRKLGVTSRTQLAARMRAPVG